MFVGADGLRKPALRSGKRDWGYDLLRALGSASCVIRHETRGTICYGPWVLHLVSSDTRQAVPLVTAIVFCILYYQTPDRGYDLIWALDSASCVIRHQTRGTICYGHWVLHLVLSDTRQGVRFVTSIWVLHLVVSDTRQGIRFVTGIGFCILCNQTPDRR